MKRIGLLIVCSLLLLNCKQTNTQKAATTTCDLEQLKDSGVLVALTLNSSLSYFHYRGEPMGYQYEVVSQFAKHLGVKLDIKTARNTDELVDMLLKGEGDLIAYPLPVTKQYKEKVHYCGEENITHQVLVQRRSTKTKISNLTELIGKEVYAKPGKHLNRLNNLNQELGGGILVKAVQADSISTEDLITKVSKGEIDYAICDDVLARLNRTYYPNIDGTLPVSFDQRSSWAVRKGCPHLSQSANEWYLDNETTPALLASSKRYFEISKRLPHAAILNIKEGRISQFDELFKKYAQEINWDWRLLASLAYTESNFDSTAVSWAGAKGLMQLMPHTAQQMGMPEGMEFNPEESIKAAVKYLGKTTRTFRKIKDPEERIKFVLASYNSGSGHILDAMALAEKYGKNKEVWNDNVAECLLWKSKEEYFNDPVCKFGYFRAGETYQFVKEILQRTEIYKKKIKE